MEASLSAHPDILVIGAGISGTATACFLAQQGCSVGLVDTHGPAWGASGRNPGFLWMQSKPAAAVGFFLAARAFAEELAGTLPDYGFRASGGLLTCRHPELVPKLQALAARRQAEGMPCAFIDGEAARAFCPALAPAILGALHCPLDAHQDTRRLVSLLAEALEARGGTILRDTEVASLEVEGGRCRGARLADGTRLSAGVTVLAAGPWSNRLLAPLDLAIPYRRVGYEAAQTAPAPFEIGPVICGQAVMQISDPDGYPAAAVHPAQRLDPSLQFTEQLAQHRDGSIQFGCAYSIEPPHDQATVAGQAMATSILCEDFPALAHLPVLRVWAGIVAETRDALPVLDAEGPEGLIINAGNSNGNLSGAFCGALAADLVLGRASRVDRAPLRRARLLMG